MCFFDDPHKVVGTAGLSASCPSAHDNASPCSWSTALLVRDHASAVFAELHLMRITSASCHLCKVVVSRGRAENDVQGATSLQVQHVALAAAPRADLNDPSGANDHRVPSAHCISPQRRCTFQIGVWQCGQKIIHYLCHYEYGILGGFNCEAPVEGWTARSHPCLSLEGYGYADRRMSRRSGGSESIRL